MLAQRIRALAQARGKRDRTSEPVDARPGCAYGAVLGQQVKDLDQAIGRVEGKVNALLGGLALFLLVEIVKAVRP